MRTNPTTIPTAIPTAGLTADRRRRRRAARATALLLAAAAGLGAIGSPASADTPPAPAPSLGIATPPPTRAPSKAWGYHDSVGDTWADVSFLSTAPKLILQVSDKQHTWVDGKATMGAVLPQLLFGTPVPGKPGDLATATTYRYTFTREGLLPGTPYYALITMPGGFNQVPSYGTTQFTTKRRYVRMVARKIHVSNDADHGLRGKGELFFGFRTPKDGHPYGLEAFGSWTKEVTLGTGDDLDLTGKGYGDWKETRENTVHVQVQGIEDDRDPWDALELTDLAKVKQETTVFGDYAYGEAIVALPTGRYEGVRSTIVHADVQRSPELVFQAEVQVDVWYE